MNSVTHAQFDHGPHTARMEELLAKMRRDEQRLQQLTQEKILQGSLRGVPSLRNELQSDGVAGAGRIEADSAAATGSSVAAAPQMPPGSKKFDFVMPGCIVELPALNQETRRFARYRRPMVASSSQPAGRANPANGSRDSLGYNILCPGEVPAASVAKFSGVPTLPSLPMHQLVSEEAQTDASPRVAAPTKEPASSSNNQPLPPRTPNNAAEASVDSGDVFTRSEHGSSRCSSRTPSRASSSSSSVRKGQVGEGRATARRLEKLERLLLEERQGRLDVLQKMQQLTAYVLKSSATSNAGHRVVPKPPMQQR